MRVVVVGGWRKAAHRLHLGLQRRLHLLKLELRILIRLELRHRPVALGDRSRELRLELRLPGREAIPLPLQLGHLVPKGSGRRRPPSLKLELSREVGHPPLGRLKSRAVPLDRAAS